MLIRSNPWHSYHNQFSFDHRGLLLITRNYIIATGFMARVWCF